MSVIGGIYALERLAGDSERDRAVIIEVLARIAPPPPAELKDFEALIGTDRIAFAQAVRDGGAGADLTNANLAGADLRFVCLDYADFTRARLTNAKLMGARLAQAHLNDADISNGVEQLVKRRLRWTEMLWCSATRPSIASTASCTPLIASVDIGAGRALCSSATRALVADQAQPASLRRTQGHAAAHSRSP